MLRNFCTIQSSRNAKFLPLALSINIGCGA